SDLVGRAQRDPSLARRGTGLVEHVPPDPRSLGVCAWAPLDVVRWADLSGGFRGETQRLGWATRGSWTQADLWTTTDGSREARGVRDVVAGACDGACRRGDAVAAESCDGGGSEESVRRGERAEWLSTRALLSDDESHSLRDRSRGSDFAVARDAWAH